MENSNQQRQQSIQARNSLNSQQQAKHSLLSVKRLLQTDFLQNSQKIAVYLSQDGELDTKLLIENLWSQGKQLFLPKILDSNKMVFVEYSSKSYLSKNKFNMLEPTSHKNISLDDLDLVIMPLTAFDKNGNRIGMGGGYYDKSLQLNKDLSSPALLVGWAHQCQQLNNIKPNPWDIRMNAVITETNLYLF